MVGFVDILIPEKTLRVLRVLHKPKNKEGINSLDGTYIFQFPKSGSIYTLLFEEGYLKQYDMLHDTSGTNWEIFNYRLKCNSKYSYTYRSIHVISNKKIREGCLYCDDKKGKIRKNIKSKYVGDSNYFNNRF